MDSLFVDLKFGVRTLRRSAGYTVASLLTLMLGIGATTAVFSLVYGILLAPLPFREPDRLIRIWEENVAGRRMSVAWQNFTDWQDQVRSLDVIAAHTDGDMATVLGAGEPLRAGVSMVSGGFLNVLGVTPVRGRDFLAEEHKFGGDPAVIVSDAFWRTRLGSRDIAHEQLTIGTHNARIVGVMPPGFDYPADVDIWYPLELNLQGDSRTAHNFSVVGRLAAGTTIERAKAELDAITQGFADGASVEASGTFFPRAAGVRSLHEELVGDLKMPLGILLGASVLVLLISCTNVASSGLARSTARAREFAVRRALGAGRGTLVRQLFIENLLLAFAGAVLGVLLAGAAVRVLPALAPAGMPRIDNVRLDGTVLGVAVLLTLLTAILFGLLPTLRLAEGSFGGVSRVGRGETGHGRNRVWKFLIATEVALAFVLLVGSVLLIRSFVSIMAVDPGYRTTGALTATLSPLPSHYPDDESKRRYYDALMRELLALPGVAEAGLVSTPPMANVSNGHVDVQGGPEPGATGDYQLIGGDYFKAMGIALVRGRAFDARDHENAPDAVIVNRIFAERVWPGLDPIGKQMTGGGMDTYGGTRRWATVIGVVEDVRQRDLTADPRPTYYFSYRQRPFRSRQMTAILRSEHGTATLLATAVRTSVRRIDSNVPVTISTIDAELSEALTPRRFTMFVLVAFSGVSLLLACVGIWGVVAYAVTRRRREIGIRMALGSEPSSVRSLVQRDYLLAAAGGGVVGLLLSFALTRLLEQLLFEVEPTDPVTFAVVIVSLGTATWVASFLPSVRATRISPLETMRVE